MGAWTVAAVVTPDSVVPSSGAGLSQTFSLQYSDSNGGGDISTAWVYITASYQSSAADGCLMYYARATNKLYLLDNGGASWGSGGMVGGIGSLANSQCGVNLASSTAEVSGSHLTLGLAMTFAARYAGAKNVYMYAANGSVNSGWQARGAWTVPAPAATLTADSVMPSSGGAASQTFALQYSDSNGGADISTAWVYITASFSGNSANSCLGYYARSTNTLYLLNDAGNGWGSGGTVGSAGSLSNSQCSVNLGSSSAGVSATHLTMNLAMTFAAGYAGAKSVYMYAANGSANSGWQMRGTWTVPGLPAAVTADSVAPGNGSGFSQTFTLQYSDSHGAGDISTAWVYITSSFSTSAANSCLVYYAQATNTVYLLTDAGNVWGSGAAGSAGSLSNSQCSVNLGGSSAEGSGTHLTVNLVVTFTGGYAGGKNVYLYAANGTVNSGWQVRGAWTVP